MLTYFFAVFFLAIAILSVVVRKTYAMVPVHELKRQAANDNQLAGTLYRAVGFGASLTALLWIGIVFGSAVGFVLLVSVAPTLLSIIVIAALLWLNFSWLPSTRVSSLSTRVTVFFTPVVVWKLHYLDPILQRFVTLFAKHYRPKHSGVYELQDMLDLLDLQSQQADSRVTSEEIDLMRKVLTFGDKKVRDVLRPREHVKAVALGDTVGPILLDELHASGQAVFPVKKSARSKEIVASLHLADLGIHSTGTVEDYVTSGVKTVDEGDTLASVLHAFYQTKQQLFVVTDQEAEFVGIVTLEDILHVLVGRPAETSTDESAQTVVE
jgi:CBS domain containing-hemolysin-like protein